MSLYHQVVLNKLICGYIRLNTFRFNKYIGEDVYKCIFKYCLLFDTQILNDQEIEVLLILTFLI